MVPDYLAERDVSYPIYTTDLEGLAALFPDGEVTVPVTLLVDEQGIVIEVVSGWSKRTERRILELAGR